MDETDALKQELMAPTRHTRDRLVGSGCTLLNLACSGNRAGAYLRGTIVQVVGDSNSGKTILSLTSAAEVCNTPGMEDLEPYFDDVEAANSFDIPYLFGKKTAKRLKDPPHGMSDTVQDLRRNLWKLTKAGKPFLYVLDSWDALTAKEEEKRTDEEVKRMDADQETKGSYRTDKAKFASEVLRQVCRRLKATGSILIIISQTRDNLTPMSFEKKIYSGGRALKFYASHQIWLASAGKIKKGDDEIGVKTLAKVKKNKLTGQVRTAAFSIYYDLGIDDTASMVEYLKLHGKVVKAKGAEGKKMLTITGMDVSAKSLDGLVRKIEDGDLLNNLRRIVSQTWDDHEKSLRLGRKRRYA